MALMDAAKRIARRALLGGLQITARPRQQLPMVEIARPALRLLVIRPDHLGDVLLTTPALHRLRLALPDAEITALVLPSSAPALANNADVDRVLTCDFPGFSRQPKANALAPYSLAVGEARRLQAMNFDAAINLRYDFWWGALLASLADIPTRVGYDWPEKRQFLSHAAPLPQRTAAPDHRQETNPAWHAAALNLVLVDFFIRTSGTSRRDTSPTNMLKESRRDTPPTDAERLWYTPAPDDVRRVTLQLGEWGVKRDNLIAIHVGSGATIKLWTVSGWVAVADGLAERHGAQIMLVGGAGEEALVRRIAAGMRTQPFLWLAGGAADSSFGQLAALFAGCRLVLGLDSGALHLAVAVDTPTIHLFGPTDPTLFGPWGDPAQHRVIRTVLDLPCQPCGVLDFRRQFWRGGYCMRSITPEQVLNAATDMRGVYERGAR